VVKIYSFVPNNINKNIFVDKSNIMDYSYFLIIDLLLVILNGLLIYKASKIQFAVDLDGKVNKLIKLYEEAIIVVKELPSNVGLEKVNVKTFEDLLDLEQSLKIPIMYFNESDDKKVFAIYADKYVYQKIFINKKHGR
ncbi:MAG: DUF5305 family protein, partial [Bacilli bacterium]